VCNPLKKAGANFMALSKAVGRDSCEK